MFYRSAAAAAAIEVLLPND